MSYFISGLLMGIGITGFVFVSWDSEPVEHHYHAHCKSLNSELKSYDHERVTCTNNAVISVSHIDRTEEQNND